MASSQPLLPDRPFDPVNRRISILVMTREAEERLTRSFESAVQLEGQEVLQNGLSLGAPPVSVPGSPLPPGGVSR